MDIAILIPIASLGGMGFVFAVGLAYASKRFAVEIDPRVEAVEEALASVNCGSCGFPGCKGYAEAVVAEEVDIHQCAPGGADTLRALADIMGIEITDVVSKLAVAQCRGGYEYAQSKFTYDGLHDCRAAQMVSAGFKACTYGCLSMGSCAKACPFNAIIISEDGLPVVDEEKCTACGICVSTCPRDIMTLIPMTQEVYVDCVNKDRGRGVKAICEIGCIACRLCVRKNPEGEEGIEMGENLPIMHYEKLPSWPEANEVCPQDCFVFRKPTA